MNATERSKILLFWSRGAGPEIYGKDVLAVGKIHKILSGLAIFSSTFCSSFFIASLALIIML